MPKTKWGGAEYPTINNFFKNNAKCFFNKTPNICSK